MVLVRKWINVSQYFYGKTFGLLKNCHKDYNFEMLNILLGGNTKPTLRMMVFTKLEGFNRIMQSVKIMTLTQDDAHHSYMVSLMERNHNVCCAVVEESKAKRWNLLKNKKYSAFFWAQYHAMRRSIQGCNRYRRHFFGNIPFNSLRTKVTYVDNVNSDESLNEVRVNKPDIIIVMGTSILHEAFFDAAGNALIINIHGGFLPYYKGNHCFFFALLDRQYDKIGSTIHFIDRGVDTGSIICHAIPDIENKDDAESLYCKSDMKAIHMLDKMLLDFENGINFSFQPQEKIGKQYFTSDRKLYHELIMLSRKLTNRVYRSR